MTEQHNFNVEYWDDEADDWMFALTDQTYEEAEKAIADFSKNDPETKYRISQA